MGEERRGNVPLTEDAVAEGAEGDDVLIGELDLEQGDVLHDGGGDGGDEEEDGGGEEEEGAEVVEESHFDVSSGLSRILFVDGKSEGSRSSRYEADEHRGKRRRRRKRKEDDREERDVVLILPPNLPIDCG
jgi:hypothetical protein